MDIAHQTNATPSKPNLQRHTALAPPRPRVLRRPAQCHLPHRLRRAKPLPLHGYVAAAQDYELGVTFPIMDIMTFFGTAKTGSIFRADSFRVHVACLVPGAVAEGSEEKESVEDVLGKYNITGGDEESGAQALGRGRAVWAVGIWALVVGAALVV